MPDTALNDQSIKELVDLGRAQGEVQEVGNTPVLVIPSTHKVVPMRDYVYNEHAQAPHRKIGTAKVLDAASFCEYYTLFHDINSRVFADETNIKILAVLDYHAALDGGPRWGQHRVDLTLRHSEEWKRWHGKDGEKMTQMEFAEFIEDNAPDIIDPSGATVLEVASDLSAKTDADFSSAQRLVNGQVQFKYSETIKAQFGSGNLDVPERFKISIPIHIGGERVELTARLRYRIQTGKLTFWYDLLRADVSEREAFIAIRKLIADTLQVTIINGTPA